VALHLVKVLGADTVKIEPLRECGMAGKALRALFGLCSGIRPVKTDLTGVDTLVIATPVWAGKVPPYVNRYLELLTGGAGKPFHVIVEMAGSGDQSAIRAVRKRLEGKGLTFASSATTLEKDVDAGTFTGTVESFAAGIRG